MDIHRSRFVPYPVAAINCLAFSHKSTTTAQKYNPLVRLAVGRANGDIEIWNPSAGDWVQELVCRGGKDRSVEGLAWIEDDQELVEGLSSLREKKRRRLRKPRLFSVGYSTAVTEWDLGTGTPLRHSTGHNSEVWCMAVQPRSNAPKKQKKDDKDGNDDESAEPEHQDIAVGCADGTIALLSTADNDLVFSKLVARATKRKARVLSLEFQSRYILVAGFSDSAIRILDIRSGTTIRTMNFGGSAQGPRDMLVWSVKCLPNGNIVSGDSSGDVRIWDGQKHFQIQHLTGHKADILDLAVSLDGKTIFSAGMDRKISVYDLEKVPGANHRFVKKDSLRYHDHDVKALCSYESSSVSILVSGGMFAAPPSTFEKSRRVCTNTNG